MNQKPLPYSPSLFTRAERFLDPQGRQVILHGVNLSNKNPSDSYLGSEGPADFAAMRRWGFNCVRLGIFWDGLEPEPGVYNETYLQGIDQRIDWARENDLYVFLDMHQDLYSVLFGDGAPEWATLTDGQPHLVPGGVWSDAYFISPAVQAALDNFWKNAPAPDGTGLQDHYAQAWQNVARRYTGERAIIGYDLMNEPFPGSAAAESMLLLFDKGASLLSNLDGPAAPSAETLAMQWLDPDGRFQILQRMRDIELYAQVIDATYPLYSSFEKETLLPLYRKVAEAIRAVDRDHILFLGTSMGSNMGVYSAVQSLQDADGEPDPQQAYAPHGYDLVVDTPNIAQASPERVAFIFTRHSETARNLHLPMIVGEWGAFNRHIPGTLPAAWMVSSQFEQVLCGDTYWLYEDNLDQLPAFPAISRPYPERVAGLLEAYHCDPEQGTFHCTWQEDPAVDTPSLIYIPAWLHFNPQHVLVEPAGAGYRVEMDGSGSSWLSIPPVGQAVKRKLRYQ